MRKKSTGANCITDKDTYTHRDTLLIAELEGFNATNNLIHVPSNASWIVETEHEFVLGIDDKYCTDSQRQFLLIAATWVDHPVRHGDGTILITNDGELDLNLILAMSNNVFKPLIMRFDGIDR